MKTSKTAEAKKRVCFRKELFTQVGLVLTARVREFLYPVKARFVFNAPSHMSIGRLMRRDLSKVAADPFATRGLDCFGLATSHLLRVETTHSIKKGRLAPSLVEFVF